MDLEREYTCPDCGEVCQGFELQEIPGEYVCPYCGCIQDPKEVRRQLGNEEEE